MFRMRPLPLHVPQEPRGRVTQRGPRHHVIDLLAERRARELVGKRLVELQPGGG